MATGPQRSDMEWRVSLLFCLQASVSLREARTAHQQLDLSGKQWMFPTTGPDSPDSSGCRPAPDQRSSSLLPPPLCLGGAGRGEEESETLSNFTKETKSLRTQETSGDYLNCWIKLDWTKFRSALRLPCPPSPTPRVVLQRIQKLCFLCALPDIVQGNLCLFLQGRWWWFLSEESDRLKFILCHI